MPTQRSIEGGDLCAIFVHAGAGYHSVANEKIHLSAVNDAAKVGMAILKNGGNATDAVEMAIRLLEDREITNAGYGSNLTLEGHVECDATMVDYLGRSGAVGAVSQVKNPIALARVVLDATSKPLSLQRVPPNFIVGPGAVDFAAEHGIPILPHEYMISQNARSRYLSWKQDLLDASRAERSQDTYKPEIHKLVRSERAQLPRLVTCNSQTMPNNTNDMPQPSQNLTSNGQSHAQSPTTLLLHENKPASSNTNYHKYARVSARKNGDNSQSEAFLASPISDGTSPAKRQRLDGSHDDKHSQDEEMTEDRITDTVGCIAIDCFGRIAAGSSSGGIGMKHRGRCGPAALVGIGTAVVPVDAQDPTKTCVATVTSGTGEHMATTSAAATAADRLYFRVRREGTTLLECDEDEALFSMIKNDFVKHPGVQNQPCAGAIGVLAVKKTRDGIYFYFGHNTDSFAIASMHSEERRPVCTMSRNKGDGSIAQGGRVARTHRMKD